MTMSLAPEMGRFSVQVVLSNNDDLAAERLGVVRPEQIRRLDMRGVVDSGAVRLVIPATAAKQLGLNLDGMVKVRYADGRTAEMQIARSVHLSYGSREGIFTAIVEPDRDSALIGAIVMEDLDLLIDCPNQRLVPRDPNQIISEIE